MDLKSYLHIVWKHKLVVVATVVVVVVVAAAGTFLTKPTYSAATLLRVATAKSGTFDQIRYDPDYTDRLINTYLRLAISQPVRDELRQRLNITVLPGITAEAVAKSELIQLMVDDSDPELAANTANTLAQILIEQVQAGVPSSTELLGEQVKRAKGDLDQALKDYEAALKEYGQVSPGVSAAPAASTTITAATTASAPAAVTAFEPNTVPALVAARNLETRQSIYASLLRQYEQAQATEALLTQGISVMEPAIAPATPISPRPAVNVLLALAVGLVAGLGLAFLVENWHSR